MNQAKGKRAPQQARDCAYLFTSHLGTPVRRYAEYRVQTPPCVIPYLVLAARAEKESSVLLIAIYPGNKAGCGV